MTIRQAYDRCAWALLLLGLSAAAARAQSPLTLDAARQRVRAVSPTVAAARAALDAAVGQERQAGAFTNPYLSYTREQVNGDASASQDIAALEQPIEIAGQRSARAEAARLRRQAADARLRAVTLDAELDVARAFVALWATDRRTTFAQQGAQQFARATAVMNRRLAEGDVSGYAARRVRLEAARYGALALAAELERQTARLRLGELLQISPDSLGTPQMPTPRVALTDSLLAAAVLLNPDVRAAELEAHAAASDARVVRRDRIPTPTFTAGYKRETTLDDVGLSGFVAGIGLTLPLWDRRAGAVAAATAEARRLAAEREVVHRRVALQLRSARAAVERLESQLNALQAQLGAEASAALRAAEAAYAEGEITLAEWLDAVRAYQEAESSFTFVSAETLMQHAQLERLLGTTILR